MWLLSLQTADQAVASRLATAALTPRETEVLSSVAKGKTNRDVGDIPARETESLSFMPAHHAKTHLLVVANARHSPLWLRFAP